VIDYHRHGGAKGSERPFDTSICSSASKDANSFRPFNAFSKPDAGHPPVSAPEIGFAFYASRGSQSPLL
jgi:hypothetical protein